MSNYLKEYIKKLNKNFLNPELELRILLKNNLKIKKEIILSNVNLNDINLKKFNIDFDRRIKYEPISKIYNSKSFWKYNFYVNQDVLDPRPETELIIEKILKYYPDKKKYLKILDMCTGSGCLAISLAKEYVNAEITATDISIKAINISKKNAKKLKCINQIQFVHCDVVKNINIFDVIVCNPPYLSEAEYTQTTLDIKLYEPKVALVATEEGYGFYKKISKIIPNLISNKSKVFIEIGYSQAKEVINLFKMNNMNCIELAKDIQKLDRVLILNKS